MLERQKYRKLLACGGQADSLSYKFGEGPGPSPLVLIRDRVFEILFFSIRARCVVPLV